MSTDLQGNLICSRDLDTPQLRTEAEARADRLQAVRRRWRCAWQRFWTLRWENQIRRPSWRVEQEQEAGRAARDLVRQYASLRGWGPLPVIKLEECAA